MNIPENKATTSIRGVQKDGSSKGIVRSNADNKMLKKSTGCIGAEVNVDKNQTASGKQITGQTKIPLKRAQMVGNTISNSTSPTLGRTSMSKLSITLKETAGSSKNLATNASKLSFSKAKNSKVVSPRVTRCLTARSGSVPQGISHRSASTISYKSLRGQKVDDTSRLAAGDTDNHSLNLSARERVAENNKLRVFESMQHKLQDMQSDFLQKFESLKITSADKMKYGFKFITLIKNDECKLLIKDDDLLRLPKKIPLDSVADLKAKVKTSMDKCSMDLLEQLKRIHSENTECLSITKLDEIQNELDNQQNRLLTELNETINLLCSGNNSETDAQIIKMQKELHESRKTIQALEKKVVDVTSDSANELQSAERQMKTKCDNEIAKKDAIISELQKKVKNSEKQYEKLCNTVNEQRADESNIDSVEKLKLIDDVKTCKDNMHSLTKKLQNTEQHLHAEKKEKQDKIEIITKLETELDTTRKKIEELQNKNEEKNASQIRDKQKEIVRLKNVVSTLETEKTDLQTQLHSAKHESSKVSELRQKLQTAENQVLTLQADMSARERERSDQNTWPLEIQNEMERCRQSEIDKQQEVQNLKMELSKAHFNICQLEEQIHRDQQLLEVRGELISSLQSTDNNQRIHLEEMFAQVGEKNTTINEVGLNNELRTKSEEFRNLFTTLSTKQMELSRQEHMIKLLEESNERSQMLRVKQEEKIGRLEEEIAQLKQTIGIYQNNVIGNTGCKNLLFTPMSTNDEYNENFYYYANERRRKRQVDINVKKYEI